MCVADGAPSPRDVDIDGCVYREGLNAVRIDGGVAGNVVPDACTVVVNFRFAPDRSPAEALQHVRDVLDGLDVRIEQTDAAASHHRRQVFSKRRHGDHR
jgi:succinyl-diaminopimelate desuccinylase